MLDSYRDRLTAHYYQAVSVIPFSVISDQKSDSARGKKEGLFSNVYMKCISLQRGQMNAKANEKEEKRMYD